MSGHNIIEVPEFLDQSKSSARMTNTDIYRALRHRICFLDYQPGRRLNERELAAEFGVSRTPMRTVLQRLEYDGLIVSQHGTGTKVTSTDLSSIRDIYVVRMRLVDAMAESEALPITSQTLRDFNELEESCRALLHQGNKRQFADIIIRQHGILHGLSRSAPLRNFSDILFFRSAQFWFQLLERIDFAQQVGDLLNEFRMIRTALELRDVRLVATIHKAHLAIVLSRLNAMDSDKG
ncbi:DNA-binding GntR family transcriptional regulator [Mesorhizobium loti]|uniref:DNA-binding GntR family transcriptional regulator n=1 Tax=Rhizobium loti TaxID=381 RepID=A0A8E2W6Y0_RHILI|nr:GntR family transcriptional regulator [Mesorhizobium loti]PWJ87445.1 DNA-binding GntR family transcriptional regulator [Mesorhizobium loti]